MPAICDLWIILESGSYYNSYFETTNTAINKFTTKIFLLLGWSLW